MGPIALATTTRYQTTEDPRFPLARELVQRARTEGFPVLVVDGSPTPLVGRALQEAGATVLPEPPGSTMGATRRLALREAGRWNAQVRVWIEPEKAPLIPSIGASCAPILCGDADLTVPARDERGFASYPPVQRFAELCGNAIAYALTGRLLDLWFGPRAMNARALPYFLDYDGKYGDRWDAIFIPVLRAVKDGLRVQSVPVVYEHPAEQTRAETSDVSVGMLKRLDQLTALANALITEAQQLQLV